MGSQGTSVFTAVFWMRSALAVVYVSVPALLVGASVWWATRRSGNGSGQDGGDSLGALARRARHGRLAGLGAGADGGGAHPAMTIHQARCLTLLPRPRSRLPTAITR